MRRESDTACGRRQGRGRRARDRLLSGDPPAAAVSTELDNLYRFAGDDLCESAVAVAGIERFLVDARDALAATADRGRAREAAAALDRLLGEDPGDRVDDLAAALAALVRRLTRLRSRLG